MPLFAKTPDVAGEFVGGDGFMKHSEVLGESVQLRSDVTGSASASASGGDLSSGAPDPQQVGLLLPAVQAAREAARGDTADDDSFVFKIAGAAPDIDGRILATDDLTLETGASNINDTVMDDVVSTWDYEQFHFAPDDGSGHGVEAIIAILIG